MPVEVEIVFDNGEKMREHWDGQSRWIRYGYVKKAKAVSAEIDPDHHCANRPERFNNSKTVESQWQTGRTRSSNYWLFLTQLMSQAMGWWAV